jgi:hypothetical protein
MAEPATLKIHEETTSDGLLSPVFLQLSNNQLSIVSEEGALVLPDAALARVMSRFGAPFDAQASVSVIARLELDQDRSLRHVRHLAGYDVIARDYLVYDARGEGSLCVLSTTVTAALMHLGRAASRESQPNTPNRLPDE